jgi:hypothetical protein
MGSVRNPKGKYNRIIIIGPADASQIATFRVTPASIFLRYLHGTWPRHPRKPLFQPV